MAVATRCSATCTGLSRTLSSPIRAVWCEGLTAIHDGAQVYGGRIRSSPRRAASPQGRAPGGATHPVTGRKALYVNRNFTTRIVGLKRPESDAMLEMLDTPQRNAGVPVPLRLASRLDRLPGTTARQCIIGLLELTSRTKRLGYRVTVKGDKPFHRSHPSPLPVRGGGG